MAATGDPGNGGDRIDTPAQLTDHLHLGPGWTAVLLEACCVRAERQRRAFLPDDDEPRHLSCRWIHDAGVYGYGGAASYAAKRGIMSLLRWLRARGCPWDEWTCREAAGGGHLDKLQQSRALLTFFPTSYAPFPSSR